MLSLYNLTCRVGESYPRSSKTVAICHQHAYLVCSGWGWEADLSAVVTVEREEALYWTNNKLHAAAAAAHLVVSRDCCYGGLQVL